MDNKNLNHKKILFLIVIIIIIVLCLIFFWIKNWIEDSKNNQKKMEEIKETYQVLETDISNNEIIFKYIYIFYKNKSF